MVGRGQTTNKQFHKRKGIYEQALSLVNKSESLEFWDMSKIKMKMEISVYLFQYLMSRHCRRVRMLYSM